MKNDKIINLNNFDSIRLIIGLFENGTLCEFDKI